MGISIHAAREGGDLAAYGIRTDAHKISIHAAREGGDYKIKNIVLHCVVFQSTPPVKAATED